jgi:alkaline phosphatase
MRFHPARSTRLLPIILLWPTGLALSLACASPPPAPPAPHAVVMLIGDGFGFSQLTLARLALAGKGGRLGMEAMPATGIVSTWSASNAVTDSGAGSTAFGSGVKTDNQYIGLDPQRRPTRSLGEIAKAAGWRVGYVTTTRITHATPACFYAHHDDRYDEEAIAAQLIAADVDLALGGGLSNFLPASVGGARRDGRDLLEEAKRTGWKVIERGSPLAWDGGGKLLGLFAHGHLAYALDDRNYPVERRDPSLASLTRLALDGLAQDGKPFFLLVEGGRIDHAGHDFDAAGVVAESKGFDEAVVTTLAWAREHPATLVVLTADHATGGLAINDFARIDDLSRQKASVAWMASQIRNAGAGVELLASRTGYDDWSKEDVEALRSAPDSYEASRRLGAQLALRNGLTWVPRVNDDDTHGHTGEDVPIFAFGPGAGRFSGVLDNTEIPRRMAALAGLPFPVATESR